MAVNFSTLVYLPVQDLFGRAMIFTPLKSNPGAPAFTLRGIWTTREVEIAANVGGWEGMAMVSDAQTIVDIRDREFIDGGYAVPIQGDLVEIPAEDDIPAEGIFEIVDTDPNGGGETTLTVRRWGPSEP
jgi:hypothetical protein